MISIGAVYGEPEQKESAIRQAISAAMRAAAILTLYFMLPGGSRRLTGKDCGMASFQESSSS